MEENKEPKKEISSKKDPFREKYPTQFKLISWGVWIFIAFGAWCLFFFISYDPTSITKTVDSLTNSGITVLLLGLIVLLISFGAFDMLSYGVRDTFHHMKPNPGPKKYKDYVDYVEQRRQYRKDYPAYFLPWLILGATLLIVGIVLRYTLITQ